ncbi:heavy metal-associated isoprenylated plant protein 36-like [Salvia miltiorrhiza]|uniref:heavy metal-associated isoprenylated plant protein 36-like n=1 Tax=Salvia miltiorrhiza TaxID=226208 RepID=UPI0025ABE9D0|nr:heavy metal-associated isoprenylated plant protein 36-like [Salvia miltiorrhiza]
MEKAPDADGDSGDGDGGPGPGAGAGEGSPPLTYKTWILRVSIHCGGCKKKVKKVLQNIEGVYKIEIDSKQHRVEVTGNVESGTLIKKLIRSGKNAELWSEKQSKDGDAAAGDSGEKRVDLADGPKNGCDSSGEDHAEEKGDGQVAAAQGGGGGGKKKKKKKKKKGNAGGAPAPAPAPAPGGSGWPPPAAASGGPVDQANESCPRQQVFSYPQFYYPAAEYGMSYNSAPPNASMANSYYTLPMYSYAYESYPTNLSSDSIIDFNHDETGCSIT